MRRYRVWMIQQGPTKGTWAVAADHRDGKKRKPFIYARSLENALARLRERHRRFILKQEKRRKPPVASRRPIC